MYWEDMMFSGWLWIIMELWIILLRDYGHLVVLDY